MAQGFSILAAELHEGRPQLRPGLNRLTHSLLVFPGHIESRRSPFGGPESEVQVGAMSPGRILVAGAGRVATGAGGFGESSLNSRGGQVLDLAEEGFSVLTHCFMSKYHNQNSSVKQKEEKNTPGLPNQRKPARFKSTEAKLTGYQQEPLPPIPFPTLH